MRLLKIFIQNMPRFKGDIDIDFITKQRVAEDDKEKLFHVFSNSKTSIYTNQAISQAQNLHEETQTLLDDFNRKKR